MQPRYAEPTKAAPNTIHESDHPMKPLPLILLLLLSLPSCQAQEPPPALPPIEIYFSPKGGCTEAVVKEINAAKATFTSASSTS